jgi:hypothetical protein
VIVVMVTTLVAAIGVFAVKNATQIDQAVGYARQSAQTASLAEMGTTAAIAEFGAGKAATLVMKMEAEKEKCFSNRIRKDINEDMPVTCYRLYRSDLETSTNSFSNGDLLAPTVTTLPATVTDSGSFGVTADNFGDFYVEITEKGPTGRPVAGNDVGNAGAGTTQKFARVLLTSTGEVRPNAPTGVDDDTCDPGVAAVASKKVMRARVVVGPI